MGCSKRSVVTLKKCGPHGWTLVSGLCALILIASGSVGTALAVRPFVTDDARVVGDHLAQVETSLRYDKERFQNLNLLAFGPTERLELTGGLVDGFLMERDEPRTFSVQGPLLQAKYLLLDAKPNARPGLAIAAGAIPPMGKGAFKADTWKEFMYVAMTESLGDRDRILIHWNLGWTTTNPKSVVTWGAGTQIRVRGGFHAVAEVFSNDPYGGDTGGAFQVGFRQVFSDNLQFDMTGGTGFFGKRGTTAYYGMGLRLVTDKLW